MRLPITTVVLVLLSASASTAEGRSRLRGGSRIRGASITQDINNNNHSSNDANRRYLKQMTGCNTGAADKCKDDTKKQKPADLTDGNTKKSSDSEDNTTNEDNDTTSTPPIASDTSMAGDELLPDSASDDPPPMLMPKRKRENNQGLRDKEQKAKEKGKGNENRAKAQKLLDFNPSEGNGTGGDSSTEIPAPTPAPPKETPAPKETPPPEEVFEEAALAPTQKPTPLPTWTFQVETPQIVAEAAMEACGYCNGGCFDEDSVVTFRPGSFATCGHILKVAKTLRPSQCNIERKIIEETCCCESEDEETVAGRLESPTGRKRGSAADDACTFCEGQEFKETADTITFSSGNDSVSCGGFMDLVQIGAFSAEYCERERVPIEEACCQEIQIVESEDELFFGGNLTTTESENPFVADAEEEEDNPFVSTIIEDLEESEDNPPPPPPRPGRPATIADGGVRERPALGSVNRKREPVVAAVPEDESAESRIEGDGSSSRKPLYDPNQNRASNRQADDSPPVASEVTGRGDFGDDGATTVGRKPLYVVTHNEDRDSIFSTRGTESQGHQRLFPGIQAGIHRGVATPGNL